MTAKPITYQQLKEAVNVGFGGDHKAVALYDPNIPVKTIEDVQNDVYRKLKEFESVDLMNINGVFEKDKIVGYYVRRNGLLISFALSPIYRTRKYLRKFFSLINEDFKGCFMCFLWNRNERGIRWLLKNGMVMGERNDLITQLIKE